MIKFLCKLLLCASTGALSIQCLFAGNYAEAEDDRVATFRFVPRRDIGGSLPTEAQREYAYRLTFSIHQYLTILSL